ncbi:unnamed protein product [Cladocopium goreaui]|uniref:Uncharacterized protein n=1 Tax=Cladocopium goreaui TaxID=2562237 RepID=A0A9P1CK77_9DINO|nr:unnamed protein product [Cladocopium goreaui]
MLHGAKPFVIRPCIVFAWPARPGSFKKYSQLGVRWKSRLAPVLWCGAGVAGLRNWLGMGKKASKVDASVARAKATSLQDFASAVSKQLAQKQRLVRTFDVGGTGVKTALFAASSLKSLMDAAAASEGESPELEWIEPPTQLGMAPGEEGFDAWLAAALPKLQNEKANGQVVFGVSTAGDIEHATGVLHDWWCVGGHPLQWEGRPDPHVADLMGLPRDRTFILHDGSAHLLGCSRSIVPPPQLACFSAGTGVGFGISDEEGAAVDPSSPVGARSHNLNGVPVSGASYRGIWRDWVSATDHVDDVEKVMLKEFATMARPWSMPWVSLVLGRRGMELAEAAFGCPPPEHSDEDGAGVSNALVRVAASQAYAKQWQHFIHTQFVPQFCSVRRHQVRRICFAGAVATSNWPSMQEVLVSPSGELVCPEGVEDTASTKKRGRSGKKTNQAPQALSVLPLAPQGSALIGAGIYALAGSAGAEMGLWAK